MKAAFLLFVSDRRVYLDFDLIELHSLLVVEQLIAGEEHIESVFICYSLLYNIILSYLTSFDLTLLLIAVK